MDSDDPREMNRLLPGFSRSIFAQITAYPDAYCTEQCRSIVSPMFTTRSCEMNEIDGFCWQVMMDTCVAVNNSTNIGTERHMVFGMRFIVDG